MAPWKCCRFRTTLKIALLLLVFAAPDRARALDAAEMQAMVIAEGDEGRGSAFLVKMDGKTYLITNSHVVRGNRNMTFKDLRNMSLVTGPLEIADKVDAVRAEVPASPNVLTLDPHIDQMKIGDEVIVAGNSEGEGVVREIPGKIVGIGPDRVEVDAQFVPGNSGSPILLKSTGKVIGVATYMKIPRGGGGAGAKSPMSLNEVRRFGYRIDTVAGWVKPQVKDRLQMEGLKLTEMENLMSSIDAVFSANAAFVAKWGMNGFVRKERAQQYPAFAALASAIDDFAKDYKAAKTDDERLKNATDFFTRLKSVVAEDVRGMNENQFTGYYGVQLKQSLKRCQDFSEWFEGTTMPAYRDTWLSPAKTNSTVGSAKRAIDPTKLHLVLTDHVAPNEPADYCHHVSYPAESEPGNLDFLFWVIENPKNERNSFPMHKTGLRVHTPVSGSYRVFVEYRGADKPSVVSNVVEIKINSATADVPPGEIGGQTVSKDAPYVNSLGMKFVPVAGTKALFCIWDTRVRDYTAYAEANTVNDAWKKQERHGAPLSREPEYPVLGVSWEEAHAFCQWLAKKEIAEGKLPKGASYRLPTDEEWSLAVGLPPEQGATPEEKSRKNATYFPWGSEFPPPPKVGNYADSALHEAFPQAGWIEGYVDGFATTSPVGSFPANAFGLFDMGGNVWQWCEDWLNEQQKDRVLRGASWNQSDRPSLLSAARTHGPQTYRGWNYGFRCVLEIASKEAEQPAPVEKVAPFVNTLGMQFLPVPIVGEPANGASGGASGGASSGTSAPRRLLFSVWDTRVQDYEVFVKETHAPWRKPDFEQGPTHPAVNVNWVDAHAFCDWLTERERKAGKLGANDSYRLPTDHEWSCAVGIGAQEDAAKPPYEKDRKIDNLFPWGWQWPPPDKAANLAGEETQALVEAKKYPGLKEVIPGYQDGYTNTSPVGSFTANQFGLFDMAGNVWQWCEEWADKAQKSRVLRGSSWKRATRPFLLSSRRFEYPPNFRFEDFGFRCVLETASPSGVPGEPAASPQK